MDEAMLIASSDMPVTIGGIVEDLKCLGVRPGMTLLVHSSLTSMGWVCGGSEAVILALEEAIDANGTLVMPTYTGHLSDPESWRHPAVPSTWWETIRRTMPPFDLDMSATAGMGAIPETFRKQRGVRRSAHPQCSFAAFGIKAGDVVSNHSLSYGLGEQSPLARLYDLGASVLLIGVGYDSNTSFHLAEYRANCRRSVKRHGAPLFVDNERRWIEFEDYRLDESDFVNIGEALERETNVVHIGRIGKAHARLMYLPACVDFAVLWMESHRSGVSDIR